jgi:putative ABC transport system substrate-binding protein
MENIGCNRYLSLLMGFVLLGAAAMSLGPAEAQTTLGVIMTGDISYYRSIHEAFVSEMATQGLGPDKCEILVQKPAPNPMSWTNAARKFMAYDVDLLVTYGMPATLAAIKEGDRKPLVFAGVYYPHTLDLDSGNATGISSKVPVQTIVQRLKSLSNFSSLGVLYNPSEKDTVLQANRIKDAEERYLAECVLVEFRKEGGRCVLPAVDVLLVTTSAQVMADIDLVLAETRKARIPTAAAIGGAEANGVILTITADPREQGRTAAQKVARILGGTPPTELPVDLPKQVQVVINLKEANALGLKIPFEVLSSATRVIK